MDIFRKADTCPSKAGRRARRQFSEEFRAGAVRLVLNEGKIIGAVARDLDLTPSSLAYWVKHARADRTQGKTGLDRMAVTASALARLHRAGELRAIYVPDDADEAMRDLVRARRCGRDPAPR